MAKLFLHRTLLIIYSITLISIMGVASLTPAFPGIARALHITPKEVGLLITAFTLPGIFLTPVLGILADRYGRKRILVPSLFLFAIAGTACFFIHNFEWMVVLRFIQGSGAAALGSINVTLIGDIFKGNDRPTAMGYNASVLSVGTASYPIIGGALATIGWYYPFLLPSLAVLVGMLVVYALHNPEPKNEQTLKDYFKTTLATLHNKNIYGLFLLSLLTFVILYGPYLTYLPFLIEETFSQPPYIIGIIMSFASFASLSISSQIGRLTRRFSEKKLIVTSCFLYFFSMVSIPFVTEVWQLIFPAILFGFAQGTNLPSLQSLLAGLAPMNQRAAIMSVNGMIFRLGQTLGPLIIVPVYAIWGLAGAYDLGGIVAVMMLFIAIFLLKTVERKTE
ncbi:MAG: MFS transporter [bacterium]